MPCRQRVPCVVASLQPPLTHLVRLLGASIKTALLVLSSRGCVIALSSLRRSDVSRPREMIRLAPYFWQVLRMSWTRDIRANRPIRPPCRRPETRQKQKRGAQQRAQQTVSYLCVTALCMICMHIILQPIRTPTSSMLYVHGGGGKICRH